MLVLKYKNNNLAIIIFDDLMVLFSLGIKTSKDTIITE